MTPNQCRRGVSVTGGVVAATLVLVAAAAGVGHRGTTILRHDLVSRVDQKLVDASNGWAQAPRPMSPTNEGPNPARPPSNFYVRGSVPRPGLDGHQ